MSKSIEAVREFLDQPRAPAILATQMPCPPAWK